MSYIEINQKPGNLSAGISAGNDGLFGKIGRGSGQAVHNKVYMISSSDDAKHFFGEDSELTKSCMLHFSQGGSALKCLTPTLSTVSPLTSSNETYFTIASITDSPATENHMIVLTVEAQNTGTGFKYKYSLDGADYTALESLSGAITIADAGVTITPVGNSFQVGNFTFNVNVSASPLFSSNELEEALAAFEEDKDIRLLHLVSKPTDVIDADSMKGVLNKLHSFCNNMAEKKQWVRALSSVHAFKEIPSTDTEAKYNTYIQEIAEFYSDYVSITYKNVYSKALDMVVSEADHLLACLSKAKVHQSPGWTGAFPQKDVVEIEDWDVLKNYYETFSGYGYESMYYEDGEASGVYPFFGIGRLKTAATSDFRKISAGRVIDKACRLVHSAVFPYLRSNQNRAGAVAGSRAGLLGMKSKMEVSLDGMLSRNEIDGYRINIPMLDNPNISLAEIADAIVNGNIDGSFDLYPNGHIEKLTIDASYALGI